MTITSAFDAHDLQAIASSSRNPVVGSAVYAYQQTGIVRLDDGGIKAAAEYIFKRLQAESYTPRTWRTHPLHLVPPEPYAPDHPDTKRCLDWLFFISSLNFSFWSEKEGRPDRYGVEWRRGWGDEKSTVHTGYWSLVAAVNRALEEGIPIVDPAFYSSEKRCPDALFERVFAPASQCSEGIPLLRERIAVLRGVGRTLCERFDGSFQGFHRAFLQRHSSSGTALDLVCMVVETFPEFRDEHALAGRKVPVWKRAQILVAEAWAAFHPGGARAHPLFPAGAAVGELTMFADYRVPQILHHLRMLAYPPALADALRAHAHVQPGSREELSIRAASVVAVERVRREILQLAEQRGDAVADEDVSSVIIDFYLWDLAKKIEAGEDCVDGIATNKMLPAHRTRSIWY